MSDNNQKKFAEVFVGKTIESVDINCCNVLVFKFSDGTRAEVETEMVFPGLYGFRLFSSKEIEESLKNG
jgi:hypothetical protein